MSSILTPYANKSIQEVNMNTATSNAVDGNASVMRNISFRLPSRIICGDGGASAAATELTRLGVIRPLIVADSGVVSAGLVDKLLLPGAACFAGIGSNPREAQVLAGVDLYRAEACDGVLAIGGGSVLDAAKLIALLATNAPPLSRYEQSNAGALSGINDPSPMVAVPTTAGTGSEVGRAALVILSNPSRRALVVGDQLMPL